MIPTLQTIDLNKAQAEAFVEDCTPEVRAVFLDAIELRIDDALKSVAGDGGAI